MRGLGEAAVVFVIAGAGGLKRIIREPTVNRPGLVLTGFTKYFANKRLQVIGNAEAFYLKSLTVEERVHTVTVNGRQLHTMCALDALSVAPMFDAVTTVRSRCHVSGEPVEITMQGDRVTSSSPDRPWVGIRWQGTSGCAARSLCLEMVFLRDEATARAWQVQDSENISILDLPAAVRFGSAFFCPLLVH